MCSKKKHRPLDIEFGMITADNVEQLRRIHQSSFPVQYNEAFYQDILKRNNEDLNKFAIHNGLVVGAICSRIEDKTDLLLEKKNKTSNGSTGNKDTTEETTATTTTTTTTATPRRLYIMTLAVLAAYRDRAVGSRLVESTLEYIQSNYNNNKNINANGDTSTSATTVNNMLMVDEVVLHVHMHNTDAIRFYVERFDFVQGDLIHNYYNPRMIDPPHCYLLYKKLTTTTTSSSMAAPPLQHENETNNKTEANNDGEQHPTAAGATSTTTTTSD